MWNFQKLKDFCKKEGFVFHVRLGHSGSFDISTSSGIKIPLNLLAVELDYPTEKHLKNYIDNKIKETENE